MSVVVDMGFNQEKDCSQIKLQGEIDIYGADEFKEKIHQLAKQYIDKDMLVDMSDLEYIDSTGLGVLIGVLKVLKPNNRDVIIANPKQNVKKIFDITNLSTIFKIV